MQFRPIRLLDYLSEVYNTHYHPFFYDHPKWMKCQDGFFILLQTNDFILFLVAVDLLLAHA